MGKVTRCVVFFTVLAALSGCQSPEKALMEEGAVQMSQAEVIALLSDKTEVWGSGAGYFSADGTVRGEFKGHDFDGTWRVTEAGNLCYSVEEWWPDEHCEWVYYSQGDAITILNTKTNERDNLSKSASYMEGDQT